MPMAGATTPRNNAGSGANAATGGSGATPAGAPVGSNKTWELSDYELHRMPQEAITDGSEIAVSPRALHSELMCPICLDMLHETMTTKECLHRFCAECIITALRSGNKECPTCRKKLVSKRSLRHDPNFDMLISKIYPSRDEYEAQQQKAMARLSKSHNQSALATSIEEGMKAQLIQNRKIAKAHAHKNAQPGNCGDADSAPVNGNSNGTPGPVPEASGGGGAAGVGPDTSEASASHTGAASTIPAASASMPAAVTGNGLNLNIPQNTKSESRTGTESVGDNSSNTSDEVTEVELVFKPHPDMTPLGGESSTVSQRQTRFIKTSANATGQHLTAYLEMRLSLELENEEYRNKRCSCELSLVSNDHYIPIPLGLTLGQICDKFWRFNKPLEILYIVRFV